MNFNIPSEDDPFRDCIGWVPDMIDRAPRFARLVRMPPRKFLKTVDPNFGPRSPYFSRKSIRYLHRAVAEGVCFTPLQMWPTRARIEGVLKHEGRHRAWLAWKLGVEAVPVYLWK